MHSIRVLSGLLLAALCPFAEASSLELFARGSASKNYLTPTSSIVSVSAATGIAITLIPRIRLEGRYTNSSSLQNKLTINAVGTLTDVLTQTSIYSVGIDIDLLGPRAEFQPYIYVGAGYVQTDRSYYFTDTGGTSTGLLRETPQTGISANAGAGFRLRIANALAFEIEAFGYAVNIQSPNPLINIFGSAGVRIFL